MQINPYEPSRLNETRPDQRSRPNEQVQSHSATFGLSWLITSLGTLGFTVVGFAFAMGSVVGSSLFSLSEENAVFSMSYGAAWGLIGAFCVCLIQFIGRPYWGVAFGITWVLLTSIGFMAALLIGLG